MATIAATAAKRERSLARIAAKLGITFVYIPGDSGNRYACYLEQIAEAMDPKGEHIQHHVINGAVTEVPSSDDVARESTQSGPLPEIPDGFETFGFSGGYVLMKSGKEEFMGPAREWRDRPLSSDTFDDERSAIETAITLATPPDPEPKTAKKGKASNANRQTAAVT